MKIKIVFKKIKKMGNKNSTEKDQPSSPTISNKNEGDIKDMSIVKVISPTLDINLFHSAIKKSRKENVN